MDVPGDTVEFLHRNGRDPDSVVSALLAAEIHEICVAYAEKIGIRRLGLAPCSRRRGKNEVARMPFPDKLNALAVRIIILRVSKLASHGTCELKNGRRDRDYVK